MESPCPVLGRRRCEARVRKIAEGVVEARVRAARAVGPRAAQPAITVTPAVAARVASRAGAGRRVARYAAHLLPGTVAAKTVQRQERCPVVGRPTPGGRPVRVGVAGSVPEPRPDALRVAVHRPRIGVKRPTAGPEAPLRQPVAARFEEPAVVEPPVETSGGPDRWPVTNPRRLSAAPAKGRGGLGRPVAEPGPGPAVRVRDIREEPLAAIPGPDIGVAGAGPAKGRPPGRGGA